MPSVQVHFDNLPGFAQPVALVRNDKGETQTIQPKGSDDYGAFFDIPRSGKKPFWFKFADASAPDKVEPDNLWRPLPIGATVKQVWTRSWHPFTLTSRPQAIDPRPADEVAAALDFVPGVYVSETGGRFGLGATPLRDGGVLFGFFHPHAARVYVMGDFNDWQHPHADNANLSKVIEMTLHKGYFGIPNIWLAKVDAAQVGQGYKFCVTYDTLAGEQPLVHTVTTDPYARVFGADYERNDSLVVNPSEFGWEDAEYKTPAIHDLTIYELHVHGFTWQHADIPQEKQGKYSGVIERIHDGYLSKVGATALHLLPLAEAPTPQGEHAMGYNSSTFMAVERDFGTPDELRTLVNEAHKSGLAIIADQVFNHSANEFNPLWKLILDHPDEWGRGDEGGLYFSGASPWGNRVATEREEVQNMLIDACKLMIVEYHVDGFRFDYTHSYTMHHGFLNRLADELQKLKPDVILIAENMPNESDLNREGFNGFGQWCNQFHDSVKALLREGAFEGEVDHPEIIGDMFYFSKGNYAAHTNNVVNYCESHDEHSVAHEVASNPVLNSPAAKERKSRLGLFATMVALGQPMIWMGQEFGLERERNTVYFPFPEKPDEHGFFAWASRLMRLRRRYPGLKIHGYNPIEEGEFLWIAGQWMDERHGKGKRVVAWIAQPDNDPKNRILVMINFENHPVTIDVDAGLSGVWVRLASIDAVNDLPPDGTNTTDDALALRVEGTTFKDFVLPDSSGFIYKWEAEK